MSDGLRRRHRWVGPTADWIKPSGLVPVEDTRRAPFAKADLAACGAIAVVGLALILLIWLLTIRVIQDAQSDVREQAEQMLAGEAATMAEAVAHELLMIDQSLSIIQSAWKADSDTVDLGKWQQNLPALTVAVDDLFICDDEHIIRQDILPRAIGQSLGTVNVASGALEAFESDGTKDTDPLLLQGNPTATIEARLFPTYVVRPLDHPRGWLVGASYRSAELTKLFAAAALGYNPVVALVDWKRGLLQAVVGPSAKRVKTNVLQTPLLDVASRSSAGSWVGKTTIDDMERLHVFHRIGDREMSVVVAASLSEVMAPAYGVAAGSRALAVSATVLVIAVGCVVVWELSTMRARRRQQRKAARTRRELDRVRSEIDGSKARAALHAARLRVVLETTTDGIALFDSRLRLVQWNYPFRRGVGVELRRDMPLDRLLREQAGGGLAGQVADVEHEVARRAGILQTGDVAGLAQSGPEHELLVLRGLPIAEGGFMLLLTGLARWETPPAAFMEDDPIPEAVGGATVDW